MSLVVKCGWYSSGGAEIQVRIGEIVRLLEREETVTLVGDKWYRKGRSRKEALSKPLSLAKLGEVRSWRREKFVYEETGLEEITYSLGIWNGRDDPEAVSLLVYLTEPITQVQSIAFDGLDLELVKDKWRDVLAWGEVVARHLGGRGVVSSDELMKWAEVQGLEEADLAAYAVFDGREGRSSVSAATWPEVIAPDKKRVQEAIGMIRAMVGD